MIENFKKDFKRIFLAGVLVILPLVVTVFLLHFFFVKIDQMVNPAVNRLLILTGWPIDPDFRLPGLGLVASIMIVFLTGVFTRNVVGRKMVNYGESVLTKIPIFKNVYVGAKQVIQTFGQSNSKAFSKVVVIEYPRKGIHALAFVTNISSEGEVSRRLARDTVNIFLPTTPNPTSGYYLLVPRNEIIELNMSIEDGIKMIISGGLFIPPDAVAELRDKDAVKDGH
ncbi:MAG: membrane protein [bacterium]|nr:MAG: membrane protein [bacterium]